MDLMNLLCSSGSVATAKIERRSQSCDGKQRENERLTALLFSIVSPYLKEDVTDRAVIALQVELGSFVSRMMASKI